MAMVEAALMRRKDVEQASGLRRSTLYAAIAQGKWTAPIRIGLRAVAWPAREVDALNAARIRGASEDEIRALVAGLHGMRQSRPVGRS